MSTFAMNANGGKTLGLNVNKQEQYSFPILKTEEIAKCLNELGIVISKDELAAPENNIQRCHYMFENLAEICTGIAKEDIQQPAFKGLQNINYPELHDHSIPKINFLNVCKKMMEMCEIHDFTMKDLMAPSQKRLRRQLSGIINFCKFREERLILLSDLSATRDNLLDHMAQLRDTNNSLNNRLSALREQTKEEAATISRLEGECRDIEMNTVQLTQLQNSMKDEMNALKALNEDLKSRIAEGSVQFEESTIQHKKMSMQIVSSPEKFRKLIVEVGQSLQTEQKESKQAEVKVHQLSGWVATLEESQNEVTAAYDAVKEVRSEVERQKAVILDLDSTRQTIASSRVALSEIDQNLHQMQRHTQRAEEKLSALRKQSHLRGEEAQRTIDDLHAQLVQEEASKVQVRSIDCVDAGIGGN